MISTMAPNSRTRRDNITLAIDSRMLKELKYEAEKDGLSLNAKVCEVLSKYVTFYKCAEELECMVIPSKIYSLMLEKMDERDGVSWLTTMVKEIWNSMLLEYNIAHDIREFVKFVFGNIALRAGMYSSFKHEEDGNGYLRLVFNHRYGAKWSRMLAEAFSYALDSYFNLVPERKITDGTIELKMFLRSPV